MNKISIGEMAKMNQISIQALRLYDEMGILKPIEVNPETNYRYYDVRQCAQLDLIQYMKTTGMSLKEIKETFERNDLMQLNKILHSHLSQIDEKIEQLQEQKMAVKKMIQSYNRYLKSPSDGTITLEYIEERHIYATDLTVNIYEYGLDIYENILKQLRREMEKERLSNVYYYNAGTTIQEEDFMMHRVVSDKIFVFVDQQCQHSNIQMLPASMYICMYCDDFDKEKEYIHKLYQHIQNYHLEICGDYICEVLAELPMTAPKRDMFLRLQVPIKFSEKNNKSY